MTTRVCMTKEMIDRKEFPVHEGNCRQQVTQQSPGRMAVSFSCTKPSASGEGEMILDSDTSYHARMRVNGSTGGPAQTVNVDVVGKWQGADCGSLRPLGLPAAK